MKHLLLSLFVFTTCSSFKADAYYASPRQDEIYSVVSEYYDHAWDCMTDSECQAEALDVVDTVTMNLVYIGADCDSINEIIEDAESSDGYVPISIPYRMRCGPNGESIGWTR